MRTAILIPGSAPQGNQDLIPDDGPGQAGGPGDDRLPGQLGVTPGGQVQQQDAAGGPLGQGADR